ncbi:hypothetical protein D3C72_2310240 [compost metagenome]
MAVVEGQDQAGVGGVLGGRGGHAGEIGVLLHRDDQGLAVVGLHEEVLPLAHDPGEAGVGQGVLKGLGIGPAQHLLVADLDPLDGPL